MDKNKKRQGKNENNISKDKMKTFFLIFNLIFYLIGFKFQMFFEDNIDDAKYCGHLYGLGTSFVVNGSGGYLESNGENTSSS